ncbi:MAG: tyrosine-type recombinase/integrase [Pseudodesulfovibrio sp.]|uniref:tyrosine-type recombinase/integrase n=1 Tax=Pseudodesulfovibrio sp. TaxID=2035812 RepID=UPI003D0A00CE
MAIQHRKNRPQKPWLVYWRNPITGGRESESFATKEEADLKDAEVKFRKKNDRASFAPTEHAEESDGALTFDDIFLLYLKAKRFSRKNLRDTLLHMKYVRPMIGHIPATELTKADMRAVVRFLREPRFILRDYKDKKGVRIDYPGCKQNTINRKVSIVKAALNWAEDEELISENPIIRFSAPRGADLVIPPPSIEEANRIMAVASEHVRRVVVLGMGTGARVGPSELFKMKWEDVSIDGDNDVLRIWSANKNLEIQYRDLAIKPIVSDVMQIWRKQDEENGIKHIVHWKGEPINTIKTAWSATLERAGITRRIRPYDLRHSFATEALENGNDGYGGDPKTIATLMGHADPTMIMRRYKHVVPKRMRDTVLEIPDLEIPDLADKNGEETTEPTE